MDPATLKLIGDVIPLLVSGVKDGMDIIERLSKGDESAVALAKDWLGVTDEVQTAIANWEASKGHTA